MSGVGRRDQLHGSAHFSGLSSRALLEAVIRVGIFVRRIVTACAVGDVFRAVQHGRGERQVRVAFQVAHVFDLLSRVSIHVQSGAGWALSLALAGIAREAVAPRREADREIVPVAKSNAQRPIGFCGLLRPGARWWAPHRTHGACFAGLAESSKQEVEPLGGRMEFARSGDDIGASRRRLRCRLPCRGGGQHAPRRPDRHAQRRTPQ